MAKKTLTIAKWIAERSDFREVPLQTTLPYAVLRGASLISGGLDPVPHLPRVVSFTSLIKLIFDTTTLAKSIFRTPFKKAPTSYLSQPPEVRNQIYLLLLIEQPFASFLDLAFFLRHRTPADVNHALLLTKASNTDVAAEARHVFFAHNKFVLQVTELPVFLGTLPRRPAFKYLEVALNIRALRLIRWDKGLWSTHSPRFRDNILLLGRCPNLKHVTLPIRG